MLRLVSCSTMESKRVSCPVIILFLLLVGSTAARGQFNDGFLGNPWGTPYAKMQENYELRLTDMGPRTQQYRTNIETISGVKLWSCDFEYTAGRFTGVILLTPDRENSHRLLTLLRSVYGNTPEDSTLGHQWISGRTHVSYNEGRDGNAYVYFYCLTLAGM